MKPKPGHQLLLEVAGGKPEVALQLIWEIAGITADNMRARRSPNRHARSARRQTMIDIWDDLADAAYNALDDITTSVTMSSPETRAAAAKIVHAYGIGNAKKWIPILVSLTSTNTELEATEEAVGDD